MRWGTLCWGCLSLLAPLKRGITAHKFTVSSPEHQGSLKGLMSMDILLICLRFCPIVLDSPPSSLHLHHQTTKWLNFFGRMTNSLPVDAKMHKSFCGFTWWLLLIWFLSIIIWDITAHCSKCMQPATTDNTMHNTVDILPPSGASSMFRPCSKKHMCFLV